MYGMNRSSSAGLSSGCHGMDAVQPSEGVSMVSVTFAAVERISMPSMTMDSSSGSRFDMAGVSLSNSAISGMNITSPGKIKSGLPDRNCDWFARHMRGHCEPLP